MILTGRQIREGRTLAGLSLSDLATAADVAVELIVRVEAVPSIAIARKRDLTAIREALEAAGVEFVFEDDEGPGVRMRRADP